MEELEIFTKTKKRKKTKFLDILTNIYLFLKDITKSSSLGSKLVPATFILSGLLLIFIQFRNEITQILNSHLGYTNQGNISLVVPEFLSVEQYIPIPSGLTELAQNAINLNILQLDEKSLSFNQTFYISIPSIGLDRLPIKPNVESNTESVYREVLEYSLAHFQGTSLPISGIANNMVLYGHSASLTYGPQRNDPRLAFSFLPEVKVGEKIIIEINSEIFEYTISRTRVVNPDDTSIITGTPGRKTLTLFTCYPLGNNTQRYVVIARPS